MQNPHGIALCCTTHSLGGIELNVLRLAEWMSRRGHHCLIVAAADSPLHRRAESAGLECMPLPAHSRYKVYGLAQELALLFHERNIGTLFLNINHDLLLGVLAKRLSAGALKLVHTQHMQFGRPKLDLIHRWQHRQLDAWVSPLPSLAAQTRRMTHVPAERIHVIPLGIDLAPLLDAPEKSSAREALDLPPDAFVAGVVGRLDRGKGQEYLLHALAMLRADGIELHALIVGEETRGEQQGYAEELRQLARSLRVTDYVHFRGFVADVPTAYAAMDVFTLTSLSETYGMVTIEAMAAGCPVIATDSGGTPDLVGSAGAAILVPPADAKTLSKAIARIKEDSDLARRLREEGRQHATRHFSHEIQCSMLEDLLEKIRSPR